MSYTPRPGAPKNQEELWRYLLEELRKISALFERAEPVAKVYRSEPRSPRKGLIAIADGTDWNPVGGSAVPKLVVWSGTAWVEVKAFP